MAGKEKRSASKPNGHVVEGEDEVVSALIHECGGK